MIKELTHAKATDLLEQIRTYWESKGYVVTGHIVEAGYSDRLRSTIYEIQTDLLNGYPQQKAA